MPVWPSTITIMENNQTIVDIHCHILFGMDDGAKDLDESIAMAKLWVEQNVSTVVATPHFDIKKDDRQSFIYKRNKNAAILKEALNEQNINLKILKGAELYYRTNLIYEDLSPFLIEGTNFLLIELPTRTVPPRIKTTFEELIIQGYRPILAHIERYSILKTDLQLFKDLSDLGVVFQVNADTLLKEHSSWLKAAIKKNYVHLIASDAHNTDTRTPNIEEALSSTRLKNYYNNNAKVIINNEELSLETTKKISKIFKTYI